MYYIELTVRAYREKVNRIKRTKSKQEEFFDTWFICDSDEINDIDTSSPTWSMLCSRIGVDCDKWKVEPYEVIYSKRLEDRVMYVGSNKIKV